MVFFFYFLFNFILLTNINVTVSHIFFIIMNWTKVLFFTFSHTQYVWSKYCDGKKIRLWDFSGNIRFEVPWVQKSGFEKMSVRMCVCLCTSLETKWMGRFSWNSVCRCSLLISPDHFFIFLFLPPFLAKKLKKPQKCILLKNGSNDFV